jgi:hypothetical protein
MADSRRDLGQQEERLRGEAYRLGAESERAWDVVGRGYNGNMETAPGITHAREVEARFQEVVSRLDDIERELGER